MKNYNTELYVLYDDEETAFDMFFYDEDKFGKWRKNIVEMALSEFYGRKVIVKME